MHKCTKCDNEFDDETKFCPKCGAEWTDPKKKITFFERRREKEREKQNILNKSQLQKSDLDGVVTCDHTLLTLKHIGTLNSVYKKSLAYLIASILVFILCIGSAIVIRLVKMNPTISVLLLMLAFMLGFCSVAMFMNRGYAVRLYKAMKSSNFAMKKINYGKPPQLAINGQVFEVSTTQSCPHCLQTSSLHIEEFEGSFVAVCNNDRSHLLSIDTLLIKDVAEQEVEKLKLEIQQDKIEISPNELEMPQDKIEISPNELEMPQDKIEISPNELEMPQDKIEISPNELEIPQDKLKTPQDNNVK